MEISRLIAIKEFKSRLLNNERDMFIYLPPSYQDEADRKYPVLYMHDGQHVFHQDQKGESWDVHLTADRLVAEGKMREIIIVAIAHIEDARIAEYMHASPDGQDVFGMSNQGELYEQFLLQEVKPYIDREYRTLPDKANTALMGSSAGGLVSYNIGFRHPDVFGMIGALCPFFVSTDSATMEERWLSKVYEQREDLKIWMDVGDAEGYTVMEKHVRQVANTLIDAGFKPGADLMFHIAVGSGHSQRDWAARVHAPLLYFFGEIGTPVRAELHGPSIVGLEGQQCAMNAVVHYDSGFMMTDLNGRYEPTDSAIIDVRADGMMLPRQTGGTSIVYCGFGLTARLDVEIVPYVSEKVVMEMYVEVPDNTPATDTLYAGIALPKLRDRLYGGTFEVPRGIAFIFRISRGLGKHETDAHGNEIPYRSFKADDDLRLEYQVENWVDIANMSLQEGLR
ncbi:alpha/beta hydrolase-fold protein [Paenibacillus sp. J5C_2022]|uniref:alpha/beta hydrolase n=1 Tax=Paenibacillus sp. J5C2022 TaxID=2977129 RepID=UPI0021D171C3|nr:alpha/beta hydrolase-fold protein [Paenibacillus sp. J5C2022]MCU6712894.1 alpha/beta hydrolase-fold protein [Paenibacillus sp. J5C2022]